MHATNIDRINRGRSAISLKSALVIPVLLGRACIAVVLALIMVMAVAILGTTDLGATDTRETIGMGPGIEQAHAKTPFRLYESSVVFDKKRCYSTTRTVYKQSGDYSIYSAKSSRPSVASAYVEGYGSSAHVSITAKKAGKTTITVRDSSGAKRKIRVRVKRNFFRANLKSNTYATVYNRAREVKVHSAPYAKVTLKVAGRKYKATTDSSGNASIYMNNALTKNRKYKVTAKKGKLTASKTGRSYNFTYTTVGTFWSCKRYMPITAYHVAPGDVITLTLNGYETHSYTVQSQHDKFSVTLYANYNLRSYYKYRVSVKDRHGKVLSAGYDNTIRWS